MRTSGGPSALLGVLLCSLVFSELWPAQTRVFGAEHTAPVHFWAVPGLRARRPSPFSKLSPNFANCSTPHPAPLPS